MRILLIEDDIDLSHSLKAMLEKQGFTVTACADGEEGLFYILENTQDLVLLDRMLPGLNGLEVLRQARAARCTVPIILLTAVGSVSERVRGLDFGADDYLVKPFAFEELMARIRCVCRRPQRISNADLPGFGDLSYDPAQSLLRCGGKTCTLSRREGDLLLLFLSHPEQMLPRSLILSRVWGSDAEIEDGNLDNYIHFLRRRLRAVESRLVLKTARGIGYRLVDTQSTHESIG
ncbi:MAG: response regulator transcription factor [Lachnospiraceae bacterium]|nr:response regulator transcription factor [Lachnospiraceae bacterium]